jgi:DNA-directed RNA polymerase specialized sigma subunit, sigma24 homolog
MEGILVTENQCHRMLIVHIRRKRNFRRITQREDKLEIADLKKHLSVLIAQLPERQQEIFRMSREQHMTYKQIAEQLSISEKTVEYHMTAALRYLRKNLYLLSLFLG